MQAVTDTTIPETFPDGARGFIYNLAKALPEFLIDKVYELRDRETKLAWDLGLVANEVYYYVVANGLDYTRLEACGFVAYMTDNQRSPNTILNYAMTVDKFKDKSIRDKYAHLPFSHFELASRYDDPTVILEKANDLMDADYGRPPSRARLARVVNGLPEQKPAVRQPVDASARQDRVNRKPDVIDQVRFHVHSLRAALDGVKHTYPGVAKLLAQVVLTMDGLLTYIEKIEARREELNKDDDTQSENVSI